MLRLPVGCRKRQMDREPTKSSQAQQSKCKEEYRISHFISSHYYVTLDQWSPTLVLKVSLLTKSSSGNAFDFGVCLWEFLLIQSKERFGREGLARN